ncbi:MAG: hypothetical protein ACREB3_04135, partial [Burkholderiales bacterium]
MTANPRRVLASLRLQAALVAACLLTASCATVPLRVDDALSARVDAILERRGLGPDALSVIDNFLRHEGPAPPWSPPIVRELLARPLAAADAAAFFERSVPAELRELVAEFSASPGPASATGAPVPIRDLLEPYLTELAAAQRTLRSAVTGAAIDPGPILRELERQLPSMKHLGLLAPGIDAAAIDRANREFL